MTYTKKMNAGAQRQAQVVMTQAHFPDVSMVLCSIYAWQNFMPFMQGVFYLLNELFVFLAELKGKLQIKYKVNLNKQMCVMSQFGIVSRIGVSKRFPDYRNIPNGGKFRHWTTGEFDFDPDFDFADYLI